MGRRGDHESLAAVYQAFLNQRTWTQSELAERVGISTPALRKILDGLTALGMPLEPEREHPHVYWSVPQGWYPGGLALDAAEAVELLRQLSRLPRGEGRDKLLAKVLEALPASRSSVDPNSVIAAESSANEDLWLGAIEESAARRVSLRCRYFSLHRGAVEWRHVSVYRVKTATPARFLVVCHRDDGLKWFRVDAVFSAECDPNEPFRPRSTNDIDAFVHQSIDGFHRSAAPIECRFRVRLPESRWVSRNLPDAAMQVDDIPDGIRVTLTTSAVVQLARFVVGLGGAARCETAELSKVVKELAKGALEAERQQRLLVLREGVETNELDDDQERLT